MKNWLWIQSISIVGLAGLLTGCGGGSPGASGPPITLASELAGLTDVQQFAKTPRGKAAMESSYDRTGLNSDWATWTGPGEDGLYELANLKGPGCLKRIWMTSTGSREWLFFFDGEKKPRVKVPLMDMFGESDQFPFPICGKVSGGYYSYMPMPY
ncbi:MAG: hypothetical protein AAF492_23940, partial [Verrucomicrobiota bacterium]